MVLAPSWSVLPYHLTWISLLLLYGVGYRSATRGLIWCLLVPVMAGAALLFADARIRATAPPYDELIELPVTALLLFAITRHVGRRDAALAALEEVSGRNADLVGRQRAFIQNASHELRTPITVALAHAELLPGSIAGSGAPEAASDVAIVVDELERLHRLVDRLLLLATAERDDRARLTPTRLVQVADDALRRWEPIPRRWLRGGRDDVTVMADPDRLAVVLDTMLDNAVRFTRDGDWVEVSVRRRGSEAAVTVADSGPGIPPGQLTSVFDRFERAGPPGDDAHHFGLGLSIVRAIAEAHGGRVAAAPGPAGGAVVTVWLPLQAQAAGAPHRQERRSASQRVADCPGQARAQPETGMSFHRPPLRLMLFPWSWPGALSAM
jgi:signal transduction histidine kinase